MARTKLTNCKPVARRVTTPLLLLATADEDLGIVPADRASVLASELACALLVPVAIRDVNTDRLIRHVFPTAAGRA